MMDDTRAADERLLDRMREAVTRVDPVPSQVLEAGRAVFTWRTIDAELAALTHDSSAQPRAAAGVRSVSPLRMLRFESHHLTVAVQIMEKDGHHILVGDIDPPQPAEIQIVHSGGIATVLTDERGRFRADGISSGDMRLRCRLFDAAGDRILKTDWVLL